MESLRDGEPPLSPVARLFQVPSLTVYVVAIMGCKTSINPQVIKEGFRQVPIAHPRFTSKLVQKGGKIRWTPTKIDLDDHIIVPEIDSNIEFPDRFVEDYISNLTQTTLDLSKPLWELHILNIKTSDAEAVAFFRIHHSLGDGISLVSLLLSATRKTSDPEALPTVPSLKRESTSSYHCSNTFCRVFVAIWWWLGLIWHTMVDTVLLLLTILFIKDTHTPLKSPHRTQLKAKRFVHYTINMDDIKLVKNEMKTTINDVLLGATQAGLTRYLSREYGMDADSGATKQRISHVFKNIRLRAGIAMNIRRVPGIQNMSDMLAKKSKARWGNVVGLVTFPFSIALHEDPLEYVRHAKAKMDRKKHSLEANVSYFCTNLALNLFGMKVAEAISLRYMFNTTLVFSNVPGPMEEISFYGHPIAYIAPGVYGQPHALTFHLLSYANQMTISLSVDPTIISNPYLLCDDLKESFKLIRDAVQRKINIENII
ncbi:wax ester synthase/diacylglycerol acyltransferase 11-like [Lotus japonicus]|uniref:wax ester synthase/diacylglycerol acyltransferase 11-like n=1 Tax=Lotus japonicus TaxID=34305 RepID=UPI00258486F8|nr:wax ester synthase/diacylglycerol acyltransferase 11-like [Lotus japonicus]